MVRKTIVINPPRLSLPKITPPPNLAIDNLTILLLAILLGLLTYQRFFSIPRALVHPLLLGKQAEVSGVRKKGETGIYRSFATGHGTPLTVRPAGGLKTVRDVVSTKEVKDVIPRCILDTSLTDEALTEILRLLPLGLRSLFPSNHSAPILTLLPSSPTTSLPLLLLQLSSPSPLIVLSEPKHLTTALTSPHHPKAGIVVVHVSLVDDVLEQVLEDSGTDVGVVIVGDTERGKEAVVSSAKGRGMRVVWWEDIWEAGEDVENDSIPDVQYSDVHSYFYSQTPEKAEPVVTKFSHINVTAGIAGLLSLFPADQRPSSKRKDVVASAERLDTPLGMTIALASIWSGASFRLIGPSEISWDVQPSVGAEKELKDLMDVPDQPKPTILFVNSTHHKTILERLHETFLPNPFAGIIAHQKIPSLQAGHVARDTWGDKHVLGPRVREKVLGGLAGEKLRGIIVVGDAPQESTLGLSHLLLSLPVSRLHTSPYSAGPVFVTHYYDIQSPVIHPDLLEKVYSKVVFEGDRKAHVGAPGSNVEVKLVGVADGAGSREGEEDVKGGKMKGNVWIRGPGVGEVVGGRGGEAEGWVGTGVQGKVQTNGTFVVG